MSYILDALRRAENERTLGQTPTIDVVTQLPSHAPATRQWPLLAGVALLAALLAGTSAYWLAARPAPTTTAGAAPAPAEPFVTAPAPGEAIRTPVPPPLAAEDGPRTLDDLLPDPAPLPVSAPVAAMPVQPVDVARAEPEPAVQPDRQPAAPALPAREPEPQPAAAVPPPVEPVALATPPQPTSQHAGPPWLRDMPPGYRADFPQLSVEVHVYNPEPAQRFVLIGGRRYREGGQLMDGPRLLEIAQDGLIFEFRGQRVRYPITR